MGEKRGDVIYAAFLLLNNGGGIAVKKIWITIIVSMLETEGDSQNKEDCTYDNVIYDTAFSLEKKGCLRSRYNAYIMFSESEKKFVFCSRLTAGKGTNRYYEGTYEGNVGEAIILHTENDSKLDGVNLDFSGGKMYYDDDEYTSTDVTTVISKAELYR